MKDLIWTHGNFFIENNFLWFVPFYHNIICKYNLNNQKIESIKFIDEVTINSDLLFDEYTDLFFSTIKFKSKIVAVPSYSNVIVFYEESNNKLDRLFVEQIKGSKYLCSATDNQSLYLFPYESENVLKVSGNSKLEISYLDINERNFVSSVQIKNDVYLVANSNKVFAFDLCSKNLKCLINVINDEVSFNCIGKKNDNELILIDVDGNIYEYDITKDIVNFLDIKIEKCSSFVCHKNRMFAFPYENAKGFYVVDFIDNKIEFVYLNIEDYKNKAGLISYSRSYLYDDYLYVMNLHEEKIVKISTLSKEITFLEIDLNQCLLDDKKKLLEIELSRGLLVEKRHGYRTLENYLKNII